MNIIYNILIIIIALLFFETLGNYIANKIFKRTFIFNVPFGFIAYMAFFEILNFFPMTLHFPYTWILYVVIPITLVIMLVTFIINGKKTTIDIKRKLKTKYYWLVIIMSILFGIYVMFNSIASSDSWLFMPLTLSGIQNGVIYSNDGLGNVVNFTTNHVADGYYLFQSMMASISRIDPFTYIMGPYRIIEVFVIFTMFSIIFEVLFKKYKFGLFLVVSSSLFFALSIFTPYITNNETNWHFMNIMATGTQMLICVIIPMLFIYYYTRDENTNHFMFWLLITFAGFGFSSSSTFVICIFVFAIAILDAFYLKNTSRYKYYLIPALSVIFYFYTTSKLYDSTNNNYSLFLIIFACICIIMYFVTSKLSHKVLQTIITIITFIYVLLILYSFLDLDNTTQILNNVSSLNKKENYSLYYNGNYYKTILSSLITTILFTLGVYRFYKTDKKIFTYILVVFIFFANVVVYSTLGAIINQAVYHRVYMLLVMNIITISGLVFLAELISKKWNFEIKYIWLLIPLLMMCFYDIPKNYQYDTSLSFTENKMIGSDLYDLYMYDYPESNVLDISSVGLNVTKNENQYVDQIYKVHSDLQYTQFCDSDCYELYHKGTTPDGEVVLETDNYILVYKEAK